MIFFVQSIPLSATPFQKKKEEEAEAETEYLQRNGVDEVDFDQPLDFVVLSLVVRVTCAARFSSPRWLTLLAHWVLRLAREMEKRLLTL